MTSESAFLGSVRVMVVYNVLKSKVEIVLAFDFLFLDFVNIDFIWFVNSRKLTLHNPELFEHA